MGDISTQDFERVGETFPLGEAAARRATSRLMQLALPADEYRAWHSSATSDQDRQFRIAEVRFVGLTHVNPAYLQQRTQIHAGDVVDIAAIGREAQRLSTLEDLESVSYQLQGDPTNPVLQWLPQEKSWGPHYLKADLGLHASAANDSSFLFYLQHSRTWINKLGGQWRNEVQLGTTNLLGTSFYQPLDVSQRLFIEPRLSIGGSRQDVYTDGARFARYRFNDATGQIDFGMNLNSQSQLRVGYAFSRRDLHLDTGLQLMPEGRASDAGIIASAIYDSRDTPFNPTHGLAAAFEYMRTASALGSDRRWQRAELGFGLAVPLRSDVLWINAAGGTNFGGTFTADRLFVLGGPNSLPGYNDGELRAGSYWTVSSSYLWKLKDIFTLRGQTLFAGVRLQGSQAYDRLDGVANEQIGSASIYLTGRTPVGPLTIGYAATTTDSWSLWLGNGRPIGNGTVLERGIFR